MKKGQMILLSICAASLCIVIGIFLGRNIPSHYIAPMQPVIEETIEPTENVETVQTVVPKEGPLDLNTATKRQLMELPGIGEVLAQRILDYRQTYGTFVAVEDLLNVQGIGEKKLEQIEPFVGIGG